MKKWIVSACILATGLVVNAQDFSAAFNKADVKKVMRSVADWQIAHQMEVKHQP